MPSEKIRACLAFRQILNRLLETAPRACSPNRTPFSGPGWGRPQKAAVRPVFQSAVSEPSTALPEYQKGDMLEHKAFGRGMVLSAQKVGGDTLLEIAFDGVGTKRLMLKYTAQLMKKL